MDNVRRDRLYDALDFRVLLLDGATGTMLAGQAVDAFYVSVSHMALGLESIRPMTQLSFAGFGIGACAVTMPPGSSQAPTTGVRTRTRPLLVYSRGLAHRMLFLPAGTRLRRDGGARLVDNGHSALRPPVPPGSVCVSKGSARSHR
jgi:hypothetical protein